MSEVCVKAIFCDVIVECQHITRAAMKQGKCKFEKSRPGYMTGAQRQVDYGS